ncbi:hypothetical protein VDGL01_00926 [Verticillium dahliae]
MLCHHTTIPCRSMPALQYMQPASGTSQGRLNRKCAERGSKGESVRGISQQAYVCAVSLHTPNLQRQDFLMSCIELPLFNARLPEAPHKPWRCAPLNQALMTVWGTHHLVVRRVGAGPSREVSR